MDVDPDRVMVRLAKEFHQIEPDRIKRRINVSMILRVIDDAMNHGNDTVFSSDIFRGAGISVRLILFDHDAVTDRKSAI